MYALSKPQSVSDGVAPSGKGPFTITDRFGATAVTANGDGIAVSPNINRTSNNSGVSNQALLDKMDKLININEMHKNISQQGRVLISNDQVIARENLRSNLMHNPIYFA
jgi:peptidoglycan hydrolase-like amidase